MDIVTLGAALNGAKKQTENYVGSHFKGGSNIQITNNPDGTQTISASGEVSAEDTVARETISDHISDKANPHEVTAAQVGLGNVNNTSDIDKPVSTAMQTALDAKANTADIYSKNEVDTALSSKQNTIPDLADIRSGAALGSTAVQPVSGKGLSTNDYTTAEKEKLAAIEAQANKTVVDDTLSDSSTNPVQNKVVQALAARLVDAGAKNFLKNEATSQSIVTVNADGSITINGTAPANTDINITISTTTTLEPGDYIWSVANGASGVYFSVRPGVAGTTQYTCTGTTTNKQFSIDERTTINRIYLFINHGTTVQELTFKPMICTEAAWKVSQHYVPPRPSYDELVARIEALEQAAGINSVRNMVNLTTETVADATETEDGEMR